MCNGGLLLDIMHDVLEGALQYEVKVMLQEMIHSDGYFTVDLLNSRLINTELGYMEQKDRPTPIDAKNISNSGHTLSQAGTICMNSSRHVHLHIQCMYTLIISAAQMWLLCRILPLAIGDLIPDDDDRWENFLRMREITDMLFSPCITSDDAAYLETLIHDHHEQFSQLYPEWNIIPKMHFLIHAPRLLIE